MAQGIPTGTAAETALSLVFHKLVHSPLSARQGARNAAPSDAEDKKGGDKIVALTRSGADLGLEARTVEMQCHIGPVLPRSDVVGLPERALSESRDRVQAALAAMGLALRLTQIAVNL